MFVFILFLLGQVPPAPRTFDESIQAFARGDDGARRAILWEGPAAIRPLGRWRAQSPARIDALLYEIKVSCAGDPARCVVAELEEDRTCSLKEAEFWTAFEALAPELGLLADPRLRSAGVTARVTLDFKERPGREILDSLCRQTGLDYGFFYGHVLVARPGRLWPASPESRARPLSEAQAARAQALVEKLSSDGLEERIEALDELHRLGPEILPLLERNAARKEPELVARCRDLIEWCRGEGTGGVFHEPAASRQILGGDDLVLARKLLATSVSIKVHGHPLENLLKFFLSSSEVPCRLSPAAQAHAGKASLDVTNLDGWTAMALVCHSEGFDFMIEEGAFHIDTQESIDEKVGTGD
jgi:hypothetical protein